MFRADPQPTSRSDRQPFAPRSELALTVELVRDSDSALLRVLSTLHRRRCRVTAAQFHAGTGPGSELELRLLAPPAHADRVEHWLAALVEVKRVRAASEPSAAACQPAAAA